jgi:hypothetical protein
MIWSVGPLVQSNLIKPKAGQPRRIWSFGPLVQLNLNKPDAGTREGFGLLVLWYTSILTEKLFECLKVSAHLVHWYK